MAQLNVGLTSLGVPPGWWDVCSLVRATACLEGFTAALRSGLIAGEGLRELDHPGARLGPGWLLVIIPATPYGLSKTGWLASDIGQRNNQFG